MRGAGGTEGGVGRFFLGLAMMLIGLYLLLDSIQVRGLGLGYGFYSVGGLQVRSGVLLIPAAIGIGMVFYDGRSILGWLLGAGSLVGLIVVVIANVRLTMVGQSALTLTLMLGLLAGGAGLFLSSLRSLPGGGADPG